MKLKPFALILVLLALFAVSDRALTSAEAMSAHPAVAMAAIPAPVVSAFYPASVGCPDICCDQLCTCVRHGFGTAGHCTYQQACVCS